MIETSDISINSPEPRSLRSTAHHPTGNQPEKAHCAALADDGHASAERKAYYVYANRIAAATQASCSMTLLIQGPLEAILGSFWLGPFNSERTTPPYRSSDPSYPHLLSCKCSERTGLAYGFSQTYGCVRSDGVEGESLMQVGTHDGGTHTDELHRYTHSPARTHGHWEVHLVYRVLEEELGIRHSIDALE
ncbi:hypothetical protein GCM10010245_87440 [Streptomyces spectabilis]|nr:hypothetical protein GCM10010245_87440 [Streptomyces spectabilis]